MKYLALLRHAKSSWKDPAREDFDRPLNRRGRQDAPLMGQRLAALGEHPDMIISSPARRARKTARLVAAALPYEKSAIRYDACIYEADLDTLFGLVNHLDNAWQAVMLVGHNPGLTELANTLAPFRLGNLVTGSVVKFAFATDSWQDIGRHSGRLLYYEFPQKSS
jgi:phosphohistidine phosphatase